MTDQTWPIGSAKITQWFIDDNEVKRRLALGWSILYIKRAFWGHNTLMTIDEEIC